MTDLKTRAQQALANLSVLDFLDDYGIAYETYGKNIGEGWVGIDTCPWCGAENNHFCINIDSGSISCWVCGVDGVGGTIIKYLMKTNQMGNEAAISILEEHSKAKMPDDADLEQEVKAAFAIEEVPEIEPEILEKVHLPGELIDKRVIVHNYPLKKFLEERGITPEMCVRHRLRFDSNRSMRLIFPIRKDGNVEAWQGRDVTGRAILPYITLPKGYKLGRTLYNYENFKDGNIAVIVEGVIDVLITEKYLAERLKDEENPFTVMACFSNSPTDSQLTMLEQLDTDHVLVMLDNDSWFNYEKFNDLSMDVEPIILPTGKDPASLSRVEFNSIMELS